jgi:hypothetical protein
LRMRFSAITVRTPPGPHSFAVMTARCNSLRNKFVTCAPVLRHYCVRSKNR